MAINVGKVKKVFWTDSLEIKKIFKMSETVHDQVNAVLFYDLPNYDIYKNLRIQDNEEFLTDSNFLFFIKIYTNENTFSQIPISEVEQMKKYSFPTFLYVYDKDD